MYSNQYRAMIYFVVATLFMYQGDMTWNEDIKSPEDFKKANEDHITRVIEECRGTFEYELSMNQVMTGISAYMKSRLSPQKVSETEAFTLNKP